MSHFLLLVWDLTSWEGADQAERDRNDRGHAAFFERNGDRIVHSHPLQPAPSARTVTPDGAGGFAVTDGPFAESKEVLGGYYLVEAEDLDAAVDMARQLPFVGGGSSVEVRPVAAGA